jgi:DNA-binding NtrC family response regulator
LPALRERADDILPLAHHFLRKHDSTQRLVGIDAVAAQVLRSYPWPGNVRELRNVVENMVLFSGGDELTLADLPAAAPGHGRRRADTFPRGRRRL